MININFGNLFTVELLHKYYTDQLCPDFNIAPSAKTLKVNAGHKIIARQYNNQLFAGTQSDGVSVPPSLKPFTPVEAGMQMTFFMNIVNPLFVNYTNLPFTASSGKIYYFTNRNTNPANGKKFLSTPIALYKNTNTYLPGDLAANAAGMVFRAIRSNNPAKKFATTNATYWAQVDSNQYATAADILPVQPSISTWTFASAQPSVVISVLGFNPATSQYDKPVLSQTITFTNPQTSFALELGSIDPGKYSLTVNGAQQWIYLNDEITPGSTFAVIDIYNDPAPAKSQLVNATQVLQSPVYSILFLNRATIWKYVLASGTIGTVSDAANVYQFANPASPITSLTPIPLTDKALNLTLQLTNHHNYTSIACADPQRLTNIAQAGDTYSCSEIFLNY